MPYLYSYSIVEKNPLLKMKLKKKKHSNLNKFKQNLKKTQFRGNWKTNFQKKYYYYHQSEILMLLYHGYYFFIIIIITIKLLLTSLTSLTSLILTINQCYYLF